MSTNLVWHKLAESAAELQWPPHGLLVAEAGGKTITLARWGNEIRACAHKCPHAGAIMADGFLDALGQIVCPLHRYKFSLTNGRNTSGEGYHLKTYPVEVRADGVFVGFKPSIWG